MFEMELRTGMLLAPVLAPVWHIDAGEPSIYLLLKPEFRRYREGSVRAGWMALCGEEIAFCLEDFLLQDCVEVE